MSPGRSLAAALLAAAIFSACEGPQSALDPAGRPADRLADLFWWMSAGAVVLWALVVGLTIYALHLEPGPHGVRGTRFLIVGGGFVLPSFALAGLLGYSLPMIPDLLAPGPEGSLRITVIGEQWWWRVRYHAPQGGPIELANEIRLPVGEPVEFRLETADVIHSFWIPSLAGKMDMIPGRRTRLTLEATTTGIFHGACAEYCGTSHALMGFPVVVHEKGEFEEWLARQAEPAVEPNDPMEAQGRDLFFASGCSACHTIRGTDADGSVGPDLTHVGSRRSIGAGILPSAPAEIRRWIALTDELKPNVHMPPFGMLPDSELDALASYLQSLR